jgi:N-acetylglutamate synthase-like GNAT family acetyltransferase
MHIRCATHLDIPKIREIHEEVTVSITSGRCSLEEVQNDAIPWTPGRVTSAIKDTRLIAATQSSDAETILGVAEFDQGSGEISYICVPSRYEGQRVGRELLRECLRRARDSKCESVFVDCIEDSVEFFEHLGFARGDSRELDTSPGVTIRLARMTRPVVHPFVQDQIKALEESIDFFAPGIENQWAQERIVVEGFLTGLGVEFADNEIVRVQDPPDAKFRDANFEVKELYPPKRRRHQEYKDALAKAKLSFSPDELFTHYSPRDIQIGDVIDKVRALCMQFSSKYDSKTKSALDVLVYANLQHIDAIIPGPMPDLSDLESQGWRSVSFVKGSSTSCVLMARASAPEFLRKATGVLMNRGQHISTRTRSSEILSGKSCG